MHDQESAFHLITAVSMIKRLGLYEFTLWGRDLVSVFRIRESRYYRLRFVLLRKYMRILSGHWKLSVTEVSVLGGLTVPYFALLTAVFKVLFAVVCVE